jgi:Arc/MetJ-type ribon-helix-helix transcriptional regulator
MPTLATAPLTVTLPGDLSTLVREKVASGEYPTADAVVVDIMHDYFDPEFESDEWIMREVVPILDAIDVDPSSALTSEDIRIAIQQEAAALRKQA